MRERLEFYLRDVRGFAYDVVNAVLAADSDDVVDAIARAEAVSRGARFGRLRVDFAWRSSGSRTSCGRRAKTQEDDCRAARPIERLTEDAEKAAGGADSGNRCDGSRVARAEELRSRRWRRSAALRQPVDAFFDKVMVMVDDERVRANRLALLRDLLSEFSTIADFSEIVTEGK